MITISSFFSKTLCCVVLLLVAATGARALSFYAETYRDYPYPFIAERALGGPRGKGEWMGNSDDVCIIGNAGTFDLGFDADKRIYDGPGADFIVFENAFQVSGLPGRYFSELMFVEVSTDGEVFARFPTHTTNTQPIHASEYDGLDPSQYSGFAGISPVYANVDTNDIDPFDPTVAGGDAFDLAGLADNPYVLSGEVDLDDIRWVRFVDIVGDGSVLDDFGSPIYDPYQYSGDPISINGADIDALAVINGADGAQVPEPSSLGLILAALPLGLALVKKRTTRVI